VKPPVRVDRTYDAVCLACADRATVRLTDAEYRALKPQRCERCGGRKLVEAAFETFRPIEGLPARSTRTGYVVRTAKGRVNNREGESL
jgi:hypothetical protein